MTSTSEPRVREAAREQLEFRTFSLDSLVPEDHRARLMWALVERLDLQSFYDGIVARGSTPGRPATDPKVLLTLWLYATSEGVGSARHLARLCERDNVYQWICGGLSMNHHTLSDFRVEHGDKLDELMTQLLATLMKRGVVKLRRVAQDGVRVRASAGAASFRRKPTLLELRNEARAELHRLRKELSEDPGAGDARERAAKERAAKEREEMLDRALEELETLEQERRKTAAKEVAKQAPPARELSRKDAKQARKRAKRAEKAEKSKKAKRELRVSTTDPEARVMKMGDGGFRPAYNIQYATETESRIIVGVQVTNIGSDMGLMVPMYEAVESRLGRRPKQWLVDGGFAKHQAIDELEAKGTKVYAPVPTPRKSTTDRHERRVEDTERTWEWRRRMKGKRAREIYKERGATAETVNADLRAWRGLQRLPVRGSIKVKAIALLQALTYNMLRCISMGVPAWA